jgi:RNA polymerase sigma-70 factor (ECF subfamily)
MMSGPERPEPADEDLVLAAQRDPSGAAGKAAFSTLFERYHDRVYRWCLGRVRDHDRAVDLAQDVMINAWRALPTFERRARFATWLYTIARNRCWRALRRPRLFEEDEAILEGLPSPAPGPESLLEREQEEEIVLELVRKHLEPHERLALWLRCYHLMSVDDITHTLGLATATGARGVLQSARRKLRSAWERHVGASEGERP